MTRRQLDKKAMDLQGPNLSTVLVVLTGAEASFQEFSSTIIHYRAQSPLCVVTSN